MIRVIAVLAIVVSMTVVQYVPAFAISKEKAIESCRSSYKPKVRECVRSKVMAKGGDPKSYIEGCKKPYTSAVRTCVMKTMLKGR